MAKVTTPEIERTDMTDMQMYDLYANYDNNGAGYGMQNQDIVMVDKDGKPNDAVKVTFKAQ